MNQSTLACVALACIFLGTSCSSAPKEPEPARIQDFVVAPSERLLWDTTIQTLGRLGYPVGASADPNALTITTGWKNQLSPFQGDGFRNQAEVTMDFDPQRGGWDMEVRIKHQVNMALVRPLDPAYAEWEWRADDQWEAAIILQHIRAAFPAQAIFDAERDPAGPASNLAPKPSGQ